MTIMMTIAMATPIGIENASAAAPATTRTRRISSVAYATDERLSEAKIARPLAFERRSCRATAVGNGRPTSRRLRPESMEVDDTGGASKNPSKNYGGVGGRRGPPLQWVGCWERARRPAA